MLDRSVREYVIQLDCDTLAVGPDINEVVECVHSNLSFTMTDGAAIQSMPEAAANARTAENNHIVIATERAFDRYPGRERFKYVRGSSGFAGFAKGGVSRARIEEFHANMSELMGERWREWGSEQCGSNFAVANSPGAVVLPYPPYTSFYPGVDVLKGKFFHFIGTYRFKQGFFAARAREVIRAMEGRE